MSPSKISQSKSLPSKEKTNHGLNSYVQRDPNKKYVSPPQSNEKRLVHAPALRTDLFTHPRLPYQAPSESGISLTPARQVYQFHDEDELSESQSDQSKGNNQSSPSPGKDGSLTSQDRAHEEKKVLRTESPRGKEGSPNLKGPHSPKGKKQ